jgi:hypothetical protein
MKRFRHFVVLITLSAPVLLRAETNSPSFVLPPRLVTAIALPPIPRPQSPVVFFRELLSMSPKERFNTLTNRTPEVRARLLEKVLEYQAMTPDERELRLRATELRWYLVPLLHQSPTNRSNLFAQMPDDLKPLAKSRLAEWDLLPPPLQREFLENDHTLHYFAHVETSSDPTASNPADEHRQKLAEEFNQFFELNVREKKATLSTLSQAEQDQMQKTLTTFEHLPPMQRITCVRSFSKFAGMSSAERSEFLKNAERWSQMSPAERQAWRDLVTNVPQWPPLPQSALLPPPIPPPYRLNHPSVATNQATKPPEHVEAQLVN